MTRPETPEQQTDEAAYQDALAEMMAFIEADEAANGLTAPQQDEPSPLDEEAEQDQAELYFGSVDEFVREYITPLYRRKVSARGQRRWSAEWWTNPEAIARLESLWRAWENLRLDGGTGMSTWWRDHADHHMSALFDPDGPFAASTDENKLGEPLPYTPPPPGLFPDARTGGRQ
ncbi:DUF4913 domain-containing protein [Nocardiopsis sp. CNT-189]|uniref:DUF4913 domain-containing protein n=1 Tax=Nocardiopsis oceanisediminis TaxID=2816862 RepID=UPI003B3A269D